MDASLARGSAVTLAAALAALAAALAAAVATAQQPRAGVSSTAEQPPPAAAQGLPAVPLYAERAPLAGQSLLVAIAAAGGRLVAVGDRGVIVLSDDQGASWTQAVQVPTQALLTGVCFLDAQHGIAVGHDELILTSADAGRTWQRTHYAPEAQRPLLDVWCGADRRALAVGAYSTILASADLGASWHEVGFTPAPPPRSAAGARAALGRHGGAPATAAAAEVGGGYHLNRIAAAGTGRLFIAAEAGHLYRSDDLGASWVTLASPYEGSFFGVLPLARDTLLAFGLRGHLYRSEDAGASWRTIDSGTLAMLDGAALLENGEVAIVGLAGVILVSRDGGRSFSLEQQADQAGIAAAVAAGDAQLAIVGENGAHRVSVASSAVPGNGR